MSENDRLLLERAKNGNIEAFESLIEKYQKLIFNIALRMIGNYEDANDLSQEVFIRIFKSIGSFKGDCRFSTWVYRIAVNICLDQIRKNKKRSTISLDEEMPSEDGRLKRQFSDESPGPETMAENNEIKRAVNNAIQALTEEQRTMIVLRDIQGFSYEEIAGILKCPEGTVKSRINRARQALKERLKRNKELLSDDYVY